MSPCKACGQQCRICMNNQPRLIAACTSTSCPAYPYRMGKRNPEASLSALQTIPVYCQECLGGEGKPRDCTHTACPYWPYREGHNPKLLGRGKGMANRGRFKPGHSSHSGA